MDIDTHWRKRIGERIDKLFELSPTHRSKRRPVIVVFREKHADAKFACLDRGDLERVCLSVLWDRFHAGYYEVDPEPAPPPISREEVDAMPDGGIKTAAIEEWKQYDRERSWHRETAERMELVAAALRERDGAAAFAVLEACSGGEYEGFEAEPAQKIEDPPRVDLLSVKPPWRR